MKNGPFLLSEDIKLIHRFFSTQILPTHLIISTTYPKKSAFIVEIGVKIISLYFMARLAGFESATQGSSRNDSTNFAEKVMRQNEGGSHRHIPPPGVVTGL